uniref:GP-PDE domain-containing protein n=1 Tax=Pristionchus pacificus TaxID=54126 RepID=A0A8R1Z3N2_PRIPA
MALSRVHFTVDVHRQLSSNESVFVTGSSSSLGEWRPTESLPLQSLDSNPNRWVGYIDTNDDALKFRYFIGYKLFGEVERLIVSAWEAHLIPRHVLIKAEARNGECRKSHIDLFDYYAGRHSCSEGWLQYDEENEILLSIHGKALKFYKSDRLNCKIKVNSLDVRRREGLNGYVPPSRDGEEELDDDEEDLSLPLPSHSHALVSVLSSTSSNCKYSPQSEKGVTFNNLRDYLVFRTRSVAVDFLAFFIEIFSEEGKRIGSCYALPSTLQDSSGQTSIPFINSSGRPIGQITVDYLFIRNLRIPHPRQLMDTTYAKHWKKRSTIEVGHRGAGNSYTKFAMARENTIHSLNIAAKNGADYVEFDVQLTKDKIAVIYHDFHVLLSVARRNKEGVNVEPQSTDYHEMALKDLTLSQLELLKMDHLAYPEQHANVAKLTSEMEEEADLCPFPTLIDALHKVDPDVGFNIEVKYPMMQEDGLHECANYFERNNFVDIILADVLKSAPHRRIMFSSFDPDICAMIAMKQNRYPVFFLCVGETQRYARFKDQRCSTSLASVNFACGADLLGVNFNSEDLLVDPRPVRRASELGLVSFVWGEDLDKKEHINYFKRDVGVDGIIYDRIGEEERRQNVFVVEREAKKALNLVTSGDSTPQRNCSPERDRTNTPNTPQFQSIEEEVKDSSGDQCELIQPPPIST